MDVIKEKRVVSIETPIDSAKKIIHDIKENISEGEKFFIIEHGEYVTIQIISSEARKIQKAIKGPDVSVNVGPVIQPDANLPRSEATRQIATELLEAGAILSGIAFSPDNKRPIQLDKAVVGDPAGGGERSAGPPTRAASTGAEKSKAPKEDTPFLCSETRRKIASGENSMEFIDYPFTDFDKEHAFANLMNEIYQELGSSSILDIFDEDSDPDVVIPLESGDCKQPCVAVYFLELGTAATADIAAASLPTPSGITVSGIIGLKQMSVKWTLWEYCVRESMLPEPSLEGNPIGGEHSIQLGGGQTSVVRCKNPSAGDTAKSEIHVTRMGAIGFDHGPYIARAKKRAVMSALFWAARIGVVMLGNCETGCAEKTVVTQFGPVRGGMELAGYNWAGVDIWKVWGSCRWYVERVCA